MKEKYLNFWGEKLLFCCDTRNRIFLVLPIPFHLWITIRCDAVGRDLTINLKSRTSNKLFFMIGNELQVSATLQKWCIFLVVFFQKHWAINRQICGQILGFMIQSEISIWRLDFQNWGPLSGESPINLLLFFFQLGSHVGHPFVLPFVMKWVFLLLWLHQRPTSWIKTRQKQKVYLEIHRSILAAFVVRSRKPCCRFLAVFLLWNRTDCLMLHMCWERKKEFNFLLGMFFRIRIKLHWRSRGRKTEALNIWWTLNDWL